MKEKHQHAEKPRASNRHAKQRISRFKGPLWRLKQITWDSGVRGQWVQYAHEAQFRLFNGVVMHVARGDGMIGFAGPTGLVNWLSNRLTAFAQENWADEFEFAID